MKSSSKRKVLILIVLILLVIIGALFYRIEYNPTTVKYNQMDYYTWRYNPNEELMKKYRNFTSGSYNKSEVFTNETTYNEFIEEYELEDLQMLHDFDNYNYVIVVFYIHYGEIEFDDNFNSKTKELKFTSIIRDMYPADAYDNYYKFYEIELPKNIDDVSIKYTADNNNKNQIIT